MFELKKIGFVRRASAWLLDAILLAVLTTGFMFIISLICNFQAEADLSVKYNDEWEAYRIAYVKETAEFYGFTCEEVTAEGEEVPQYVITKDGQPSSINDVLVALMDSNGEDAETKAAYDAYKQLTPLETVSAQMQYVYILLFMMLTVGLLLSFLILEFILPLFLKNGQTIGKKIFGVALVRPDCVQITHFALFGRVLIGKFAIETMFPVLMLFLFLFGQLGILAFILIGALFLLNVVLYFATKNHTPIHDILAVSVAVDIKLQMIYRSEDELKEKKAEFDRARAQSSRP